MTPAPHTWPIRVYYEDTDFSGVVYHASYLRFMERGRTEWLRALGMNQAELHAAGEGAAFAVRHMAIDFRAAAQMDDELDVISGLEELGGASLTMRQQVRRGGAVLVEAVVRIAVVAGGRPKRLPDGLRLKLAASLPT